MSTMALAGHFDTQRPQLTQSAGSITARLPCMDMACLGHALTQSVQPMQPVEQTFLTKGPLSGLLHPTCTLDFFGTRAMTPRGHSAAQLPQPTHFSRSTTATPSLTLIASNWQTLTQVPKPRHPYVQEAGPLPGTTAALRQSSKPM